MHPGVHSRKMYVKNLHCISKNKNKYYANNCVNDAKELLKDWILEQSKCFSIHNKIDHFTATDKNSSNHEMGYFTKKEWVNMLQIFFVGLAPGPNVIKPLMSTIYKVL